MQIRFSRSVDPASKLGKGILTIFLVVGIVFLAVAVIFAVTKINKLNRYVATEAEIKHLDWDNFPTVAYEANGTIYTKRLNTASSNYRIGERIRIAYDPEAPDQVTTAGFTGYLLSVIFGLIGIVFILIGGICLAKLRPKKKPKETVPWET